MKSLRVHFLTSAAVLALAGSAQAADLYKAPTAPVPYATWQGGYIGANVGVARLNGSCNNGSEGYGYYVGCGSYYGAASSTQNATAPTGGVQLGYDWQDRYFVYGVAADWSWTGLKGTTDGASFGYWKTRTQVDWLASFRGRAGLALDNTMLYLTGGLATGHVQGSDFTTSGTNYSSLDKTKIGWVAGVGVEHKFTPNWSAFAETLYYDLGSATGSANKYSVETYQSEFHWEVITARLGVNYRW